MNAVELSHLTKRYKNGRGVTDVSLTIRQGQIYGLLGPNGSGKTTIMKTMTGLIHPDGGAVTLFGKSPQADIEGALSRVGCLIEAPAFYPYLTAQQNLALVCRLHPGCNPAGVEHMLDQVGLGAYRHDKAEKYSLGMKQRLGLAMAMLSDPDLLILDEPANGLDIEGMADIRKIVKAQGAKGRTILISSHLASEIEQICTHVAILKEGRLIAASSIELLKNEYAGVEDYYLAMVHAEKELAS